MKAQPYDAVLVPGGGLLADGGVPPWVANRLERAMELAGDQTSILLLSAGTTYKPLPRDAGGRAVFESVAGARYLAARGVQPERLFTETASYDTIGNAYFARVVHCDPVGWRRLAIVTSEFHIRRTEAIFRWMFAVEPNTPAYELTFDAVRDVGMDANVLAARRAKEASSLPRVHELAARYRTLADVHAWLFREHSAYAMAASAAPALETTLLGSY